MSSPAPSIFETFNARGLSPSDVAQTFVPPPQFERIVGRNHCLIVGPRGSGKTTLLMMLQQPALEQWEHEMSESVRQRIDYTSIFVPSDINWMQQVESLGNDELDSKLRRRLSIAAFATHLLTAACTSFLHRTGQQIAEPIRPHRRVSLTADHEARLSRRLGSIWQLAPAIPSLLEVRRSLVDRLLRIGAIAEREADLGEKGRDDRIAQESFLYLPLLTSVVAALVEFNELAGEPDGRWGLLFDELELTPGWLRKLLIRSTRSTDPRLIFKLALSPSSRDFGILKTPLGPNARQDFAQVPLWYPEREDRTMMSFCRSLFETLAKAKGIPPDISPERMFGKSPHALGERSRKRFKRGRPTAEFEKVFSRLALKDQSFANFLFSRRVDPKDLSSISSGVMDSVVRKIGPIAVYREFHLRPASEGTAQKSRRRPGLYHGADAIFAATEGNPRWFIGIIGSLMDEAAKSSRFRVREPSQIDELVASYQAFRAMLRTIPAPTATQLLARHGVLSVIDYIGDGFYAGLVSPEFDPEPPLTFIVDSEVSEPLVEALEIALNAGALIYVPSQKSDVVLTSLRGGRFRLSYLLTPFFGLPPRLGRPVPLKTLLEPGETRNEQLEMWFTRRPVRE